MHRSTLRNRNGSGCQFDADWRKNSVHKGCKGRWTTKSEARMLIYEKDKAGSVNASGVGVAALEPIRISVLIPVFNRKELVGDAIRSALAQKIGGLEIIVGDNHSDDGTWEYLQKLQDERLRIFRNEKNLGIFGNFNRCAERARGEFAIFLCSDDRLAPGFLKHALECMDKTGDIALLSSRGRQVDEEGKEQRLIADGFPRGRYEGKSVIPAWFWTSYHYGANPLNYPSGVVFRASIIKPLLPFRAEFGAVADVDMFLRVLQHGNLFVTDVVGCYVMRHGRQAGLEARKTGELMQRDLQLLHAYRRELEAFGIYKSVDRQISCLVLASLVRQARVSLLEARKSYAAFRRGPLQLAYAAGKRIVLVALYRALGYRRVRYLMPAA